MDHKPQNTKPKIILIIMKLSTMSLFLAARAGTTAAFSAARPAARVAARGLTVRQMSDGPMPHDEDKMPFYALGVNLARQIGGQTSFKTLLEDEELELVLEGFSDSLKGTGVQDDQKVLTTYGQALNGILMERTSKIVDRVKMGLCSPKQLTLLLKFDIPEEKAVLMSKAQAGAIIGRKFSR